MMSTKMKGKKIFVGVSLSCLGRGVVASFLSIVSMVVVSLIPRPHLYWPRYKTNLLTWMYVAAFALIKYTYKKLELRNVET